MSEENISDASVKRTMTIMSVGFFALLVVLIVLARVVVG